MLDGIVVYLNIYSFDWIINQLGALWDPTWFGCKRFNKKTEAQWA